MASLRSSELQCFGERKSRLASSQFHHYFKFSADHAALLPVPMEDCCHCHCPLHAETPHQISVLLSMTCKAGSHGHVDEGAAGKASSHHFQPLQWKTEREATVGCCPLKLSPPQGWALAPAAGRPGPLVAQNPGGFLTIHGNHEAPPEPAVFIGQLLPRPFDRTKGTDSEEEDPTEMRHEGMCPGWVVTGGSEWF